MVQKKLRYVKDKEKDISQQRFDIIYGSPSDYYPRWALNNYLIWHDSWKYTEDKKEYKFYNDGANVHISEELILCKDGPADMFRYILDVIHILILPVIFFYIGANLIVLVLIVSTWHLLISDFVNDEDRMWDSFAEMMFEDDVEEREFNFYKIMFLNDDEKIRYFNRVGPLYYNNPKGIDPEIYPINFRVWYETNGKICEELQNTFPQRLDVTSFIYNDEMYVHKFFIPKASKYFLNNKKIIENLKLQSDNFKEIKINKELSYYELTDLESMLKKLSRKNYKLDPKINGELLNYFEGLYSSDFKKAQVVDGVRNLNYTSYQHFLDKFSIR